MRNRDTAWSHRYEHRAWTRAQHFARCVEEIGRRCQLAFENRCGLELVHLHEIELRHPIRPIREIDERFIAVGTEAHHDVVHIEVDRAGRHPPEFAHSRQVDFGAVDEVDDDAIRMCRRAKLVHGKRPHHVADVFVAVVRIGVDEFRVGKLPGPFSESRRVDAGHLADHADDIVPTVRTDIRMGENTGVFADERRQRREVVDNATIRLDRALIVGDDLVVHNRAKHGDAVSQGSVPQSLWVSMKTSRNTGRKKVPSENAESHPDAPVIHRCDGRVTPVSRMATSRAPNRPESARHASRSSYSDVSPRTIPTCPRRYSSSANTATCGSRPASSTSIAAQSA